MRERRHPEQGYRSCLGVMRLAKTFGRDRLEAACERAVNINARSYSSLHSILTTGPKFRDHLSTISRGIT